MIQVKHFMVFTFIKKILYVLIQGFRPTSTNQSCKGGNCRQILAKTMVQNKKELNGFAFYGANIVCNQVGCCSIGSKSKN